MNPSRPKVEVRRLPADLETPVSAYLKLRQDGVPGFLLESVAGGEQLARFSFLGVEPARRLVIDDGPSADALLQLRRELAPCEVEAPPGLPPFRGGAVGILGWDLVRRLEGIVPSRPDPLGLPEMLLYRFETVVAFDHVRQEMVLMSSEAEARQHLDALEKRLSSPLQVPPPPRPRAQATFTSNTTREDFCRAVEVAKEHIAAGDIFQVVLSQRWWTEWHGDPFPVYRALRRVNPSPYMVFFEAEGTALVAASPEMLVRVQGDRVETHPIAGTRPRSGDEEEDAARERDLLADPKEIAEHVMLVDLGRNDVGRVAVPGSVEVPTFQGIERYSHVCHIVSRVKGRLAPDRNPVDALLSTFPAGTVSGAPKVRAMQLIEELEPERRGFYAGAVAYADLAGNLDSCITIRSLVFRDDRVWLQAGAGIVADSDPGREYEETVAKSGALRAAIQEALT